MSPFEAAAAASRRMQGPFAHWLERREDAPSSTVAALLSPVALRQRVRSTVPGEWPWRPLSLSLADPRRPERLDWGCAPTPFGEAVFAFDAEALWHLSFTGPDRPAERLLRRHLPAALFSSEPDTAAAARWAGQAFGIRNDTVLPLRLSGTPFQFQIWRTLARIPAGGVCDYGTLARLAGAPRAARAVGTAMARNPVAWLIPCHRVIRSDGRLGAYQPGTTRKALLLACEIGALRLPGWTCPGHGSGEAS